MTANHSCETTVDAPTGPLNPPLPPVPSRPGAVRRRAARWVVNQVARRVPVTMVLPDGRTLGGERAEAGRPVLQVHRPDAMWRRLATHPKFGIGEGYMAGDWSAGQDTDLAELLLPFAERMTTAVPPALYRLRGLVSSALPHHQRNTTSGSRRNIAAHYDLSNDLFEAFLDPTLSYSSALFSQDRPWDQQRLEEAQLAKIDRVLDLAGVTRGTRVLEIGTGWGALAIAAAQRGAEVTTLTLSVEQAALARDRCERAGVAERVTIELKDYREASGVYDAVVSVEMIEAVGEEFWGVYFETIDRLLAPQGRAVIQAIVMSDERLQATRNSYGWIQRYIFPGGLIPSIEALDQAARDAGLRLTSQSRFGLHYAETLRRWRVAFTEQRDAITAMGFDEVFKRMWEFYLAYCQAGFAAGYLDVVHLVFEHGDAGQAPS